MRLSIVIALAILSILTASQTFDEQFEASVHQTNHTQFNHTVSKKFNDVAIVSFFEHSLWGGRRWDFNDGCSWVGGCGAWNDAFTSMRLRDGYAVQLFHHAGFDREFHGGSTWARDDRGYFHGGYNDAISSFKIFPMFYDKVWFYRERNYEVGQVCLLGAGRHTRATLDYCGLGEDNLSGMWIPAGFSVVLYEHDNFGGAMSQTFTAGDYPRTVDHGWEDRESSIVITYNPPLTVGVDRFVTRWKQVCDVLGTGSSCTRSYTWGVETSDSTTRSSEYTNSFSVTATTKAEFAGSGVEFSVSYGFAQTISQQFTNVLTMSSSQTLTVDCRNPTGRHVLFQWVGDAHNQLNNLWTNIQTDTFLCKDNLTPPACPPEACADATCSTCVAGALIPK